MELCRQENEATGGILESEAWQLGLYGPGRQKLNFGLGFGGGLGLGLGLDNRISYLFSFLQQNNPIPGGHYLPHFDAFDSDQIPPDAWGRGNIWVGSR